jgi:UDP-sugar transporter A1/2/3
LIDRLTIIVMRDSTVPTPSSPPSKHRKSTQQELEDRLNVASNAAGNSTNPNNTSEQEAHSKNHCSNNNSNNIMTSTTSPKSNNLRIIKLGVLCILCFQNSIFTVLRRYSQGVLKETYSKHEVLLFGEIIKMLYSAHVISKQMPGNRKSFESHLKMLAMTSRKMFALSLIYGLMNILSYVALRNVSAGIFTICAQLKILTTACFSTLLLQRRYSWTQWRALLMLIIGVLIFSEPVWNQTSAWETDGGNVVLGSAAVLTEVTLSGFASIYFEKVIKTDTQQRLNIWERNFQLALGSIPVYLTFILHEGGGKAGYLGGWSMVTFVLGILGAAGGLLVALSIKYGDSILKTLATTGAIVLSSWLDHWMLKGPLTVNMMLAGCVVITSICDYSFDATPLQNVVSGPTGVKSDLNLSSMERKEGDDDDNVVMAEGAEKNSLMRGGGDVEAGREDAEKQRLLAPSSTRED